MGLGGGQVKYCRQCILQPPPFEKCNLTEGGGTRGWTKENGEERGRAGRPREGQGYQESRGTGTSSQLGVCGQAEDKVGIGQDGMGKAMADVGW